MRAGAKRAGSRRYPGSADSAGKAGRASQGRIRRSDVNPRGMGKDHPPDKRGRAPRPQKHGGGAGRRGLPLHRTLPGNYSIVNRESVLKELKQIVEETYQKTIEFKARLESSGELKDTAYVSDEDLKVIHEDIVIEDD